MTERLNVGISGESRFCYYTKVEHKNQQPATREREAGSIGFLQYSRGISRKSTKNSHPHFLTKSDQWVKKKSRNCWAALAVRWEFHKEKRREGTSCTMRGTKKMRLEKTQGDPLRSPRLSTSRYEGTSTQLGQQDRLDLLRKISP